MWKRNRLLDHYGFSSKSELKLTDFLFLDCNNKCDFCFEQDQEFKTVCKGIPHLSEFNDQYVFQHLQFIEEYITKHEEPFESIKFTIMGGELFAFEEYQQQINSYFKGLIQILSRYQEKVSIQIVSNLMHNNLRWTLDVVQRFKDACIKYILNTSFDFGEVRFHNDLSFQTFKRNILELIEHEDEWNIGCGTILTRYMLESLQRNDEQAQLFQKIYNNFYVDFARLSGPFSYKLSFDEQVELWKIVVDRFPKLIHSSIVCNNKVVRCCLNNKHVLFTGNQPVESCVSYVYALYGQKNQDCQICKVDQIKQMSKMNGCHSCKYFGYCIPQCPLDERHSQCDLKKAIEYLEQKNGTI